MYLLRLVLNSDTKISHIQKGALMGALFCNAAALKIYCLLFHAATNKGMEFERRLRMRNALL